MDSDTKTARPRRLHFTQRFDFNQHFRNFAFARPQPWRKTSASLSVPLARSRKQVVPTIFVIRCMAAEHARPSNVSGFCSRASERAKLVVEDERRKKAMYKHVCAPCRFSRSSPSEEEERERGQGVTSHPLGHGGTGCGERHNRKATSE